MFLASVSAVLIAAGCAPRDEAVPSEPERTAIADSLKRMVIAAYDLSKPDVVGSLMSLYPPSGRVISASGGAMTTTRPQLEEQIKTFWKYVGSNMKQPEWKWTAMEVDVLSRDAAVMTSTYRIPHTTPDGMRHEIGGAWTAVFARRNGRWMIVQEHLSDAPQTMGQM
ncbi:MAG: nuclear transport factor 2 family protein [Gemmatimonadota bacterium]|nr:nuclear transport factor 2 family protein [Gemmatimonadota bacterium]